MRAGAPTGRAPEVCSQCSWLTFGLCVVNAEKIQTMNEAEASFFLAFICARATRRDGSGYRRGEAVMSGSSNEPRFVSTAVGSGANKIHGLGVQMQACALDDPGSKGPLRPCAFRAQRRARGVRLRLCLLLLGVRAPHVAARVRHVETLARAAHARARGALQAGSTRTRARRVAAHRRRLCTRASALATLAGGRASWVGVRAYGWAGVQA